MNRPPLLMRVHIKNSNKKFCLWLPLFLIFPIIAVLVLIMAPVILLAGGVLWYTGWGRPLLLIIPLVLSCLCAMRGLEVDINDNREKVLISIK